MSIGVLKAGQYRFYRGESVPSILRKLTRGMHGLNLVVIPEGLTLKQVARLFEKKEIIADRERFIELCADTSLMNALGVPGPTIEGYLYPSSYSFLPDTDEEVLIRRMVRETQRVLDEEMAANTPVSHELTGHEVLTLASIVEAEAARAEERWRIAAVYLNRLRIDMRLQADPTVAYALGGYRARLYYSDLKVKSPYNTYRNKGLPPGPIGNPGRAAIHAVLNPMPGEQRAVLRGSGRRDSHFQRDRRGSRVGAVGDQGPAPRAGPRPGAGGGGRVDGGAPPAPGRASRSGGRERYDDHPSRRGRAPRARTRDTQ